jgi:hypothetical protein
MPFPESLQPAAAATREADVRDDFAFRFILQQHPRVKPINMSKISQPYDVNCNKAKTASSVFYLFLLHAVDHR